MKTQSTKNNKPINDPAIENKWYKHKEKCTWKHFKVTITKMTRQVRAMDKKHKQNEQTSWINLKISSPPRIELCNVFLWLKRSICPGWARVRFPGATELFKYSSSRISTRTRLNVFLALTSSCLSWRVLFCNFIEVFTWRFYIRRCTSAFQFPVVTCYKLRVISVNGLKVRRYGIVAVSTSFRTCVTIFRALISNANWNWRNTKTAKGQNAWECRVQFPWK